MMTISEQLFEFIKNEKLVGLATVISGSGLGNKLLISPDGSTTGSLGSDSIDERIKLAANGAFQSLESERVCVETQAEAIEVFIDIYPPLPRLVIVGAVHIAISLVSLAKTMGYHTIVIDARSVFANRERFSHADRLIVGWPSEELEKLNINESTYIVSLTHDEKFDIPVIKTALESRARYIGVLGSKKTHANRIKSLIESGITEEQMSRIHAPIGLGIGAKSVEEIALSIMAEIVAVKHNLNLRQRT